MRRPNTEDRKQKTEFRVVGRKRLLIPFLLCVLCVLCGEIPVKAGEAEIRKAMKESLVYLDISSYGYDQFRPWRNTEVEQKGGVGCAVGANLILTPAWNLTNAKLVQAKVSWQNEYIPAKIKVIDYELDLAIIELEPNALIKPLKPLKFKDKFERGAKLNYYWLDSSGNLTTGQGYLDRAEVRGSTVSYDRFLNYIVTNMSQETGIGQVFCDGTTPIGIACWSIEATEAGLIPAVIIDTFLQAAKEPNYPGTPSVGFVTQKLLDPVTRAYLKMPPTLKNGVEVATVFNLGTGSDVLKSGDVILGIDGKDLDAHGKFSHPAYDRVLFHHLINCHKVGDDIDFDIWRDGARQKLKVKAKNFGVEQMLVPWYEYGRQPEYVVTGGFVFQKLTRPYLTNFGKDWEGKTTPHLLYYLQEKAFKPTEARKDIVILSYVLPAQINLGYLDLAQLVVSKYNGLSISSMSDIIKAQKLNTESKFDVVEFEFDSPTVVIPRGQLQQADMLLGHNYMIPRMVNVGE
jgi:hypothetical protein